MLDDRPGEEEVVPHRPAGSPQTTSIASSGSRVGVAVLHEHAAEDALEVPLVVTKPRRSRSSRMRVAGFCASASSACVVVARGEQHLDELLRERLAERGADRLVEDDHARRRRRPGSDGERLLVRLLERRATRDAARVRVLDDHARRAVELEGEQARGGEVVEVVERERLAVELLDRARAGACARRARRSTPRAGAGSRRRRARRHRSKAGTNVSGKASSPAEPARDAGVVRGGRREGARPRATRRVSRRHVRRPRSSASTGS